MADRVLSTRRALICAGAGVVTGTVAGLAVDARLGPLVGWCTAGVLALVWVWRLCWPQDAAGTRRVAREESSSRVTDDAVVTACFASLVAVVVALTQTNSQDPDPVSVLLVVLGVLGTMVAWALVNTVWALKYARLYFVDHASGGFDVKQEDPPRYSDFAYLAFTVGMSFAVSEIELTSSLMRRKTLQHALLSYFFGTVVIAVAINFVTNLGQG